MPKKGENILKFENCHRQMRAPYIIYADFEAQNLLVKDDVGDTSNTRLVAKQVPCSYWYMVVRCDCEVTCHILYRREDAAKKFLDSRQDELCIIRRTFKNPAKMQIDDDVKNPS